MTGLEQINTLLDQLAAGDSASRIALLPALAAHIVLIPMTEVRTSGDRGETKKIKLVTLTEGAKKFIPVFTTEDLFFTWSDDRYQCLPIAVEDLALTLINETEIAVDYGTAHQVYFKPEEFTAIASDWSNTAAESADRDSESTGGTANTSEFSGSSEVPGEPPAVESTEQSAKPANPAPFTPSLPYSAGREQGLPAESVASATSIPLGTIPGSSGPIVQIPAPSADALGDRVVINELRTLLKEFPNITEAFFTTSGGEHGRGILGVLSENTDSEKRFTLISAVADLSRNLLGYAGAIDVYDDLHDRQSGSWNLFVALTPFYIRADGRSDYHEPDYDLNNPAEKKSSKLPGDHRLMLLPNQAFENPDAAAERPRRKKSWLGGFRLVSRR